MKDTFGDNSLPSAYWLVTRRQHVCWGNADMKETGAAVSTGESDSGQVRLDKQTWGLSFHVSSCLKTATLKFHTNSWTTGQDSASSRVVIPSRDKWPTHFASNQSVCRVTEAHLCCRRQRWDPTAKVWYPFITVFSFCLFLFCNILLCFSVSRVIYPAFQTETGLTGGNSTTWQRGENLINDQVNKHEKKDTFIKHQGVNRRKSCRIICYHCFHLYKSEQHNIYTDIS